MEDKISVHNLRKNFGRLEVLKDISIEIRKGEIVRMIGPSGSGKSTLLRCLSRLEKITSDHAAVDGHPTSNLNTNINRVRENIEMVPQHFSLFSHLTVKENIVLAPMESKLMGKEEAGRKALELLVRVGLADKTEAYPGQLPGGQKWGVAIARSLAMNPDIMLFDGPTPTPDPEIVGGVLEITKQLAADGMTMAVIIHEMGLARGVANRAVFMDDGHIVGERTPDEAFRNPREEWTRSFLDKVSQKTEFHEG